MNFSFCFGLFKLTVFLILFSAHLYGNTPYKFLEIPGVINASEYDVDGQGIAYYDTTMDTKGNSANSYRVDEAVDIGIHNNEYYLSSTAGEWVTYTFESPFNSKYNIEFLYSSGGTGTRVQIYVNDSLKANGILGSTDWNQYKTRGFIDDKSKQILLPAGKVTLKIKTSKSIKIKKIFIKSTSEKRPYSNLSIPGAFSAHEFDHGGQGVSYFDSTPSTKGHENGFRSSESVDIFGDEGDYFVKTDTDEWLDYSVNIEEAGKFNFYFDYSSGGSGTKVSIYLDGKQISYGILGSTDWGQFKYRGMRDSKGLGVDLSEGEHVLRFKFSKSMKLKTIDIQQEDNATLEQKAYVDIELPGVINAYEFDVGGQNVSYFDLTPESKGNPESNFRTDEAVDIGSIGNKKHVSFQGEEWVEYTGLFMGGDYNILFEYSSGGSQTHVELFADEQPLTSGYLGSTDWSQFTTRELKKNRSNKIRIDEGVHVIRVKADKNFKLRTIAFELVDAESTKTPIYQINLGENSEGEWVSDNNFLNSTKLYNDGTGRRVSSFGLGESSLKEVSGDLEDSSLPHFVERTYREDILDETGHAPGLNYRFELTTGKYSLNLYSPVLEKSYSYEVRDLNDNLLKVIDVDKNGILAVSKSTIDIEIKSQGEYGITLYPTWPSKKFAVSAIEILSDSDLEANVINTEVIPTRYISPTGSGSKNGTSWQNAAKLSSLNSMISALRNTGGQILLRADAGNYISTSSLNLYTGSLVEQPIVIRGVNLDGSYGRALVEGNRTSPWVESGKSGSELFRLNGTHNIVFKDLEFRNVGSIFRLTRDVNKLKLKDLKARNFNRLLNSYKSGSYSSASLINSKLSFLDARGYTKYTSILKYKSSNVEFYQIFTDSEGQALPKVSDFSNGLHFEDSSEKIKTSYVTSLNHQHSKGSYYNADSFSSEREVKEVLFYRTIAAGNSDGGYDIKSDGTTFKETLSIDNKRNYRIWSGAVMENVMSITPKHRGGSGDAHHLGRYSNDKTVIVRDSIFVNTSNLNKVFYVEPKKDGKIDVDFSKLEILKGTAIKNMNTSRINIGGDVSIKEN